MKKIEVVEMELPSLRIRDVVKTAGGLIGLLMVIIGAIMLPTIILTLPGIGLFLTGFLIMYGAAPSAELTCTACGLEAKAKLKAKNVKCPNCETVIPLRWIKPNKKEAA